MIINAAGQTASLTADATVAGLITVADTTGFWVGALITIASNTVPSIQCVITSIPSATTMTARKVTSAPYNYGNSDLSALHLADAASVTQPPQTLQGNDETFLKHVAFWSGLV